MRTAKSVPGPRRPLRRAMPASTYPLLQMPRPAPLMPPAAFPAIPKPFVFPAEKEWSRHDSNHAPNIPRRTAHNPGDRPMTPCLLLTLTSPPAPAATSVRDAGQAASTRRGWAESRPGPLRPVAA